MAWLSQRLCKHKSAPDTARAAGFKGHVQIETFSCVVPSPQQDVLNLKRNGRQSPFCGRLPPKRSVPPDPPLGSFLPSQAPPPPWPPRQRAPSWLALWAGRLLAFIPFLLLTWVLNKGKANSFINAKMPTMCKALWDTAIHKVSPEFNWG